jgi:hypothetical protein
MVWVIRTWRIIALKFCILNQKHVMEYADYMETWPLFDVMTHFWICSPRRFIVHLDLADEILAYFRPDLNKKKDSAGQ